MPLQRGGQKAVSSNISELTHHGSKKRSRNQIIAIALSAARGGKSRSKPKAQSKKRRTTR